MAYSIPPVSLDDLRAFKAQHFIVSDAEAEPNLEAYEAYDASGWEEFDPNDDDGLGYYPDGVKRTLTDEQIKIFRHTEIQTLLRERRKKAEAEAEAETETEEEIAEEEAKEIGQDDDDDAMLDDYDAHVPGDDVPQDGDFPNNDRGETEQHVEVAEETTRQKSSFEYGQRERTRVEKQVTGEASLATPAFTRRIITYDD